MYLLVLFSMRDDVTFASITHVICLGSTSPLGTRKGRRGHPISPIVLLPILPTSMGSLPTRPTTKLRQPGPIGLGSLGSTSAKQFILDKTMHCHVEKAYFFVWINTSAIPKID